MTTPRITGYKMAKHVNNILGTLGYKQIPPQMIYSYISQGFIPASEVNGQNLVTEEDMEAWTTEYINRRIEKEEAKKVSTLAVNELEAFTREYMGA